MTNLRDILNSPNRVLGPAAANPPAQAQNSAGSSSAQPQEQEGPPQPGTPPRPANQTSQHILRNLVLTPPRPRPELGHKRMISLDAAALAEQSGIETRRLRHASPPHGLLAPFSPLIAEEGASGSRGSRRSRESDPALHEASIASASSTANAAVDAATAVEPGQANIGMDKVTLEEAKKRTTVDKLTQTMGMVFEGVEPEHLAKLFGNDVQTDFTRVETDCGSYYLRSGKVDTERTVAFESYLNKDIWVMANLFRPKHAQFRAREIIAHHAELAAAGTYPRYLVHQRITSEDGEAFLASLKLTEEDVYDLSGKQFDTFMNGISNGGASRSLLADFGLKAASAKLLVEVFPADSDHEASSDRSSANPGQEAQTPSEAGKPSTKFRYTVVLKTEPALPASSNAT